MSELSVRYEACVRTLAVSASCEKCKETCPESAITLDGRRGSVVVHLEPCTRCGLCGAACPTNAIEGAFDLEGFLDEPPPELRCGEAGLPCIGALSAEDLVTIALRHKRVAVHDVECKSREPGHARAQARVAEAQRFLQSIGSKASLHYVADDDLEPAREVAASKPPPVAEAEEPVHAGRRRLLRMFVPPLEERPKKRLEAPDRLDRGQMQQITVRRRRLLATLPPSAEARHALPEADVSFFSSKVLDAKACTACSLCVSTCPTGALQAPRSLREIRFDSSRCTKCRLCHDVCEPDAITLAEQASVEDFLDFAPRMLSRLPVAPCVECGASFRRSAPDQALCQRCQDMEDEVLELSGVQR